MKTMLEGLLSVTASISRRKGNCAVALDPTGAFALVAGAPTAVKVNGGMIVSIGLTRERLVALRDECNELLEEAGSKKA